jgi:N-acetylmuramoyl-L-alanine amidase
MRYLRLLPILLLLFASAVPATAARSSAAAYASARQDYQRLQESPKKQRYRDQWQRVIDGLLAVPERYPGAPEGARALYLAGKAGHGLFQVSRLAGDARLAVGFFLRVAAEYPQSSLADDALLLAGDIDRQELGDLGAARELYRQLGERYPAGDMAAAARRRCQELGGCPPPPTVSAAVSAPVPAPVAGETAQLTGVRFWSNPGYTRVVLELSAPVQFVSNLLPGNPAQRINPRLYLDLAQTVPAAGLADTTSVDDGLLKQIRNGRPDQERTRVVLDLVSSRDYKVFPLNDPFRIVIDVRGDGSPVLKEDAPALATLPAKDGISKILENAPVERPVQLHIPKKSGGKLLRIVVDAGHGGKDPGAIGPGGALEKDVTLAMAKALAPRLEKELGCEVIMTRDDDTFIPLEERTAIANKVDADLFISLHANASPKGNAFGVETYYLNFSKNDQAVEVAARENGTSLKQVGDLELILFDLMANAKINESSRLAAEIQRSLVHDLDRHYRSVRDLGVRQGPFYVLLGATMPSVLVETAFISNPREEARLQDPTFRARAADAIVAGVRSYAVSLKMLAAQ